MADPSLHELQSQFAAHIRNPDQAPAPEGIEDRRMAIYRRLFFNNIRNFLGSYYPVLKRIYGVEGWAGITRDFYTDYRAQSPLFPELPREFLRYLLDCRQSTDDDPPFLQELAHYEWIRHALAVEDSELPIDISDSPELDKDHLLSHIPILSPLARPLSYQYPVHRIHPKYQPKDIPDEQTHLLVYRNRKDQIKFMQLNAVSVLLLNKMRENDRIPGQILLETIAAEIQHPSPQTVVDSGADLIAEWIGKDIVVGLIDQNG